MTKEVIDYMITIESKLSDLPMMKWKGIWNELLGI
jgi:hypothetical protein